MSYNVEVSPTFKKEAKKLAKKFPSLKNDLADLFDELAKNPLQGISLGHNVYKIRMQIASKAKGKSGGARIISLVKVLQETIFLLTIYNKSDKDSISDKEIKELMQDYL